MQERRIHEVRDKLIRTREGAATDEKDQQAPPHTPLRNGFGEIVIRPRSSTPIHSIGSSLEDPLVVRQNKSEDPENDHPVKNVSSTPSVEQSVAGIHTLLRLHSVGKPRRSYV